MQKSVRIGLLLDFYGDFLTARQRQMLELHRNDDLSLAEVAQHSGLTRQGVYDAVRRGEETLERCEARLGLLGRYTRLSGGLRRCLALLEGQPDWPAAADLRRELHALLTIWEDSNGL